MDLYIPKMSDTPAITIPGLADNFNKLDREVKDIRDTLDQEVMDVRNTLDQEVSALEALFADSRIVEYGSNENGEYVRWENGLQMCRFVRDFIELTEPIPPGGTLYLPFAYPASFSELPALAAGGVLARPGWYTVHSIITPYSMYIWQANVMVHNVEENHSGSQLRFVTILAIGRWK